jgi:hypothetical protein
MSGAPKAKRKGPADVAPVTVGGLRFAAIHWGKPRDLGQNGGYVAAIDPTTDKELWTLKVYDIVYDPKLEGDVQDVFISAMSKTLFGEKLNIRDEKGRRYVVDPATRMVRAR